MTDPDTQLEAGVTAAYEVTSDDAAETRDETSLPPSSVVLLEGEIPRLQDETCELLRHRLRAAALLLTLVLAFAFTANLLTDRTQLVPFRLAVIAIMAGAFLVLRSKFALKLRGYRIIELVMFGAVGLQLVRMFWVYATEHAALGETESVVSVLVQNHLAWTVLIMIYGIFMPNTWKRAAAVLLPAAAMPFLVNYSLESNEMIRLSADADRFGMPVPLTFLAAGAAIYGSHVINSIRREAFQAKQLGRYRLGQQIGSGGMGEVFKAEHTLLKRPCAIKLIKPTKASAKALERFEHEVQSTARLTHWNTIDVYDYGRADDGSFYYVMELLPGLNLDEIVERFGPLPPARAVHFLQQTCHALAEAHGEGLIHRDIKPANIFAAQRGGLLDVVKLLDFGLVKENLRAAIKKGASRRDTTFSGSPAFIAPEQVRAYSSVDQRADIYALGAVAYFLIVGRPPFDGRNTMEVVTAHAKEPVVPPSAILATVPADLEAIVLRCLKKRPAERFPNIEELATALAACDCAGQWTAADARRWWIEHAADKVNIK